LSTEILRKAIEEEWHKTHPLLEGVKQENTTPFAGPNIGNKECYVEPLKDKQMR